jgi:S1-C subfamily serine protease
MIRCSGQREVPVFSVGNQVVIGYDLDRLNQLFPRQARGLKLGISIANAKPTNDRPAGAYVGNVRADTPADRTGIQEGDIIIEMAQRPVRSASDVHQVTAQLLPGARISLTIWRTGRKFRVTLQT